MCVHIDWHACVGCQWCFSTEMSRHKTRCGHVRACAGIWEMIVSQDSYGGVERTWQDGEVFTCGRGIEGQLGVEDITFCLFPQRVHALARQVRRGGRVLCCGRAAKVFAPRRWCFWSQPGGW